jgi:hypothetical protein
MTQLSLRGRVRPLAIGLSIGPRSGSAGGTLGVFVSDNDHRPGFLTSAFALGSDEIRRNQLVYQPSSLDAGTLAIRDVVGEVVSFTTVPRWVRTSIDAALVRLTEGIETKGNQIPVLSGCKFSGQYVESEPLRIEELGPSTTVAKIGRTTGYTEGVVNSVAVPEVSVRLAHGAFTFSDAIEIAAENGEFSSSGDAGALVFTIPNLRPIGLLFAAGKVHQRRVAYACRLDRVLELFQAELLSGKTSMES